MEQSNRWTRSREWLVLFSVGTGGVSTVHGSMCCGTLPKQHQRAAVGGSLVHRMCRISWALRSSLWDVQLDWFTGNVERIALWHWENCVKIRNNNSQKHAPPLCVTWFMNTSDTNSSIKAVKLSLPLPVSRAAWERGSYRLSTIKTRALFVQRRPQTFYLKPARYLKLNQF